MFYSIYYFNQPLIHTTLQIQMVTIQHLTRTQNSQTQTIDLSSSRQDKIHRIDSLDRFINLRCLNLANNMIIRLQNLSSLTNLKILNVEFNQISRLDELKALARLQELFASYNCIEQISNDIRHNQKLRVLHVAYNDLKVLEDIRPLAALPQLSILSLVGNPFLSALNYIAFVKMLIPSLLILDDKDASQSLITANVYPHQEICILKDALNKLLDQRNGKSLNYAPNLSQSSAVHRQSEWQQEQASNIQQNSHKCSRLTNSAKIIILNLIQQWIQKNYRKIQLKKIQISELSESYTSRVDKARMLNDPINQRELQNKIKRYKLQDQQGLLNTHKKQKFKAMCQSLQECIKTQDQNRQESRNLLQLLKNKQCEYTKLKESQLLWKHLKQQISQSDEDPHKLLLNQILFGNRSTTQLNYKELKKYLLLQSGLLHLFQQLNLIIFGELADNQRIIRLKSFLGDKSLIEIINNLKEIGIKQKKDKKKYEKQRTKMIQQLENQTQQLCDQWKQIQKEKQMLKNQSQLQEGELKRSIDQKLATLEAEQKNRIMMLKRDKDHYQQKVQELQKKHQALQIQFDRKYKELEQFERFFEEFKKQRQNITDLKHEIEHTNQQLTNKQNILQQIEQNLKEMTIKEETLQEKVAHYERKCFEKYQELTLYDSKIKNGIQKVRKINEDFNLKNHQLLKLQEHLLKTIEESRDFEKKIERHKSSLQLYEEKLRNLSELQTNKRTTIIGLQRQIQSEKKNLNEIVQRLNEAQFKLNHNMEVSYQYQMKIQEERKSVESLSDINKTITDMIERQNQLKRTNLELELETQHLSDLKHNLMKAIKQKYDDQDQNL